MAIGYFRRPHFTKAAAFARTRPSIFWKRDAPIARSRPSLGTAPTWWSIGTARRWTNGVRPARPWTRLCSLTKPPLRTA